MASETKDILPFVGMAVAGVAAFFNLRGRVAVVEARQQDDRKKLDEHIEHVEATLKRIEDKLDKKADK